MKQSDGYWVAFLAVGLALGCGSTSPSNESSVATESGNSGNSGGTSGSNVSSTGNDGAGGVGNLQYSCFPTDPSAVGTSLRCSVYISCAKSSCADVYEGCFGVGYEDGDFTGGSCEEYLNCVDSCGSANGTSSACDANCVTDCYQQVDSACQTCITSSVGSCVLDACLSLFQECRASSTTG